MKSQFNQKIKLLNELFNSTSEFKWTTARTNAGESYPDSPEETSYNTEFTINGISYYLVIECMSLKDGYTCEDKYGLPIYKIPPIQGTLLDVYFTSTQGASVSLDITGAGNSFEVFGNIVNAVKQWFNKNPHPLYITFSAKEASRLKLYRKFVQLFKPYGYKLILEEDGIFILHKE